MSRWAWLKDANYTTAAKGWSIPALWAFTGIIWGLCALFVEPPLPVEWLTVWTGALVLYSGVQRFEQKDHRTTDYGYLERTGQRGQLDPRQEPPADG